MDSILEKAEGLDEAAKQLVKLVADMVNASTNILCEVSFGTARIGCVEYFLPILKEAVRSLMALKVAGEITRGLDAEIARLFSEIEEIGEEDAVRGGLTA